jgi:hypothetical protein
VEQSVGVDSEPPDSGLLEDGFKAGGVGAFGQPNTLGIATEAAPVVIARGQYLSANGGWVAGEQREQGVGGGGSDDFEQPGVLKVAEGADQVSAHRVPGGAQFEKAPIIIIGQVPESGFPMGAIRFALGESDLGLEGSLVASAQERVLQHGAQGRTEGQGESTPDAIMLPSAKDLEQREVTFGDGLVEPGFLEESFVLRMAHEGQVGMQDEGDVSAHRWGRVFRQVPGREPVSGRAHRGPASRGVLSWWMALAGWRGENRAIGRAPAREFGAGHPADAYQPRRDSRWLDGTSGQRSSFPRRRATWRESEGRTVRRAAKTDS